MTEEVQISKDLQRLFQVREKLAGHERIVCTLTGKVCAEPVWGQTLMIIRCTMCNMPALYPEQARKKMDSMPKAEVEA